MVTRMKSTTEEVKLAIVGKYTNLEDSYLSILEAVKHGGVDSGCRVEVKMVESETLEEDPDEVQKLPLFDGILIPGGFGSVVLKERCWQLNLQGKTIFLSLGSAWGYELAVIEFARNVVNLRKANSTEFDEDTPYPVIDILPEQTGIAEMGGTMRLGDYEAFLKEGSTAAKLYGSNYIVERHRHRYEVNPEFVDKLESFGILFSGKNKNRMEIAEIPGKRFFFASQFHPEFRSRPGRPSPPFNGFVKAMCKYRKEREGR